MMKPKTGLAIASLVIGILGLFTFGLFGVGALVGGVLGIIALVKVSKSPSEYGGKGMAIAGLVLNGLGIVMIPFIGMIAAIAIPSLLRARVSANEAQTIGMMRTLSSGEAAYAQSNAGYFDSLTCLENPQTCIPGYPPEGPNFVQAELHQGVHSGYTHEFQLGPPVSPTSTASPSSAEGYAYFAIPVNHGLTGLRGFCVDATGIVCSFDGVGPPDVSASVCPATCEPLE